MINQFQWLSQAVSHEFKTPLTRLKFALTLIAEAKNTKDRNEALQDAVEAESDLENLVNGLLLYSRLDLDFFKADMQTIEVQQCVNVLMHKLKNMPAGKVIAWWVDPKLGSAKIQMACTTLDLLLSSLLSNACRYARSKIEVKIYVHNQEIVFEVADDGPGIVQCYRQKIFEPFFSLDESRNKDLSGYGLGLAVVARIVEAHQAKIVVLDAPQLKGALFRVTVSKIQ